MPGFVPPPYPYEKLERTRALAQAHEGGGVDLSIGTPCDPPPPAVIEALGTSGSERGYPLSIGTARLREAASGWMARRLGVEIDPRHVAACVGTKEFVGTLPQWLRLRRPDRDTVLYPAVAYPTYEMGAILAGCRAVPVPVDDRFCLDLAAIDEADAARALCLWINSPGNPAGGLDDLEAAATWGRSRNVPVFSDECYIEFTWDGPPRTILEHGAPGVVAVHSLSKRSSFAGGRVGFYVGDADLVAYLGEVRKHVGMLVPGPMQAAAAVALDDDRHVDDQRVRYHERLTFLRDLLVEAGFVADLPAGAFYLWFRAGQADSWAAADDLARRLGVVVSPGDIFGSQGAGWLRAAAVQTMERLELIKRRL